MRKLLFQALLQVCLFLLKLVYGLLVSAPLLPQPFEDLLEVPDLVEQLGKRLIIVCDVRDGDVLAAKVRRIQVCVACLDRGLGFVSSDAVSRIEMQV